VTLDAGHIDANASSNGYYRRSNTNSMTTTPTPAQLNANVGHVNTNACPKGYCQHDNAGLTTYPNATSVSTANSPIHAREHK
jgi:hypothetical protein